METFSFFFLVSSYSSVAYKQDWEKLVYVMSKCSFKGNLSVVKVGLKISERKGEKIVHRASAVKAIFYKIFYKWHLLYFNHVAEGLLSVKIIPRESYGRIFLP